MAHILQIDDPADPRVAAYRDIKERDLVGRQGLFIAEGETVLRAFARDAPERIESLLIDGKRADKLADLFAALPVATPVYSVGQAVLDAVAGFHLHRGVLAVGRKPAPLSPADLLAAAVIGGPDTVREGFTALAQATEADEFMLVSDVYEPALRLRSLSIAAAAMAGEALVAAH